MSQTAVVGATSRLSKFRVVKGRHSLTMTVRPDMTVENMVGDFGRVGAAVRFVDCNLDPGEEISKLFDRCCRPQVSSETRPYSVSFVQTPVLHNDGSYWQIPAFTEGGFQKGATVLETMIYMLHVLGARKSSLPKPSETTFMLCSGTRSTLHNRAFALSLTQLPSDRYEIGVSHIQVGQTLCAVSELQVLSGL